MALESTRSVENRVGDNSVWDQLLGLVMVLWAGADGKLPWGNAPPTAIPKGTCGLPVVIA